MGTYDNCYDIIADVRRDINEYSVSLVQGADEGAWDNGLITQKINLSQTFIYNLLFKRMKHEFRKIVSLTGVDSEYTLPADFAKIEWFKDENGLQVYPIGIQDVTPNGSSKRLYYRKADKLILDKPGITDTYTLYYRWKPRKIHSGKSTAGASSSITFGAEAVGRTDYYNGMVVENITQDWADEITGYTSARVATITETAAKDDYYGLVPEIPEMFHHLIAPRASMLLRASNPLAQTPVTSAEMSLFNEDLLETLRAYAGSGEDVDISRVFSDYNVNETRSGIIQLR